MGPIVLIGCFGGWCNFDHHLQEVDVVVVVEEEMETAIGSDQNDTINCPPRPS